MALPVWTAGKDIKNFIGPCDWLGSAGNVGDGPGEKFLDTIIQWVVETIGRHKITLVSKNWAQNFTSEEKTISIFTFYFKWSHWMPVCKADIKTELLTQKLSVLTSSHLTLCGRQVMFGGPKVFNSSAPPSSSPFILTKNQEGRQSWLRAEDPSRERGTQVLCQKRKLEEKVMRGKNLFMCLWMQGMAAKQLTRKGKLMEIPSDQGSNRSILTGESWLLKMSV